MQRPANVDSYRVPSTGVSAHHTPIRRRPLACTRCRRRKVRCDGALPACSNCAKAGVECFEGASLSAVSRSRMQYLENRVRELEEYARVMEDDRLAGVSASDERPPPCHLPDMPIDGDQHHAAETQYMLNQFTSNSGPGSTGPSPTESASSRITRDQPLAHEVGLLSLSNASDPKYLGPSSGVTFARLIYESAPQSEGRSLEYIRTQTDHQDAVPPGPIPADVQPVGLPSMTYCQQYAEAYFEVTAFYPFVSQEDFYPLLDAVFRFHETSVWDHRSSVNIASAQVFLVLSIGAKFLETRLNTDYTSRGLFASGMRYGSQVNLHDTIEGVQILLLLVLHSFHSPDGLNAWYLLHTIIASCLDLGLQRRDNGSRIPDSVDRQRARHLRSAIFWSAYSMDRTLTTILGRPLTLRDEAIDRDFPGVDASDEVDDGATRWDQPHCNPSHEQDPASAVAIYPYRACIYSLRFDRIVAETKLMLYRVSRSPVRFPWPTDLGIWQQETHRSCTALFHEIQNLQRGRPLAGTWPLSGVLVQRLELKYHQCVMLLFRPSPQIPHPSAEAVQLCFKSAMEIIRVYTDLHQFSNMECSWLSAHSVFVAVITMLYCLWAYPAARGSVPHTTVLDRAEKALKLLQFLGETWSVATEAQQKLSRLVAFTAESYEQRGAANGGTTFEASTFAANFANTTESGVDKMGVGQDGASLLIDELGILRDLFDLGWLDDVSGT